MIKAFDKIIRCIYSVDRESQVGSCTRLLTLFNKRFNKEPYYNILNQQLVEAMETLNRFKAKNSKK